MLGAQRRGQTTTMKTIMGLIGHRRRAEISFAGREDTISLRAEKIRKAGIAYCPEERGIYATSDVARTAASAGRG